MRLRYHPRVQRDVSEITNFYDDAGGSILGDAFFAELGRVVSSITSHPLRYPPIDAIRRRANLRRFPYHVLFRVVGQTVRILIDRHHRRNTTFGMDRE